MNTKVRKLTQKILANDLIWALMKPFRKIAEFISYQRYAATAFRMKNSENDKIILKKLDTPVVKNGVFKNMKYPSFSSCGSTIYPKIIGSYEDELRNILEKICQTDYPKILDIGCAEGYYAVGIALRCKNSTVYAYDIEEEARRACLSMAILNGVEKRVIIKSGCSSTELANFVFKEKSLIICDCEGFEIELFTPESITNLINTDILVETHDIEKLGIAGELKKLFTATHDIVSILSVDDIQKAYNYNFPNTSDLTLEQKYLLYAEGRPTIMEWLWLTPQKKNLTFKDSTK